MAQKISGKTMIIFVAIIAPLLFLLASLFLEPPIWIILFAILWMGAGFMILYIPKADS
ncbi:MAG: hypothetical protein LUQ09_06330 [Methanomassiliicoccales archaeon]|nr:hypothetical protein [Methanomassiliicoccales archaeon]